MQAIKEIQPLNTRGICSHYYFVIVAHVKYFLNSPNLIIKPSVWIFSLHLAIQQGMFETQSDQHRTRENL